MLNAIAGKFMASPSTRTASREGDPTAGVGAPIGAPQPTNGQLTILAL